MAYCMHIYIYIYTVSQMGKVRTVKVYVCIRTNLLNKLEITGTYQSTGNHWLPHIDSCFDWWMLGRSKQWR